MHSWYIKVLHPRITEAQVLAEITVGQYGVIRVAVHLMTTEVGDIGTQTVIIVHQRAGGLALTHKVINIHKNS